MSMLLVVVVVSHEGFILSTSMKEENGEEEKREVQSMGWFRLGCGSSSSIVFVLTRGE